MHLLTDVLAGLSVAALVNSLKGVTACCGTGTVPYAREHLWSPYYLAASMRGPPLSIIRQCIEQQRAPGG